MKLLKELKELQTDDYQNRNGEYPKSGIANDIRVWGNEENPKVSVYFKNTSEREAKEWTERNVIIHSDKVESIRTFQDGDYHNDWVEVQVSYKA